MTIPARMFGRNKRSESELLVSANQRNIKKIGRQSTAKRRSEMPTKNSCKMLFPITKNSEKKSSLQGQIM